MELRPLVAGAKAFVASAVFFGVCGALIPLREQIPLVVLWGLVYVAVVAVVARRLGPQYGVPLAIAAGLAFDSFYIPPTRPFGPHYWQNWIAMAVYLGLGTLIGGLAAGTRRRAETSESARTELADEQAALRRVATLVAQGGSPSAVFEAVAEELARLLNATVTWVLRYEPDGTVTVVGGWSAPGVEIPIGGRLALEGEGVAITVRETGRPVRTERFLGPPGSAAGFLQRVGARTGVGSPIVVDGVPWGVTVAAFTWDEPLAADSETRITRFTELLATAIANAEARASLTASRARVVAAADETRRRIERDLHDGAQQRLVSLALQLRSAQAALPSGLDEVAAEIDEVAVGLTAALDELREFARGIHPAILAEGGLGAALETLALRSAVPVELAVSMSGRLPEQVEVAAYYVVSEALANVAKHARASRVVVEVEAERGVLHVRVRDDGVGGADLAGGSGLVGLADRVEALGGRIALQSGPGAGTTLSADLPLDA